MNRRLALQPSDVPCRRTAIIAPLAERRVDAGPHGRHQPHAACHRGAITIALAAYNRRETRPNRSRSA